MRTITRFALGAPLLSVFFAASVYAQATDPTAPTPPLRYESAFSDYRAQQDTPQLPWQNLFTAEGDFSETTASPTPMEVTVRKPQGGHSGHDAHGSGRKVTLDTPAQLAQTNSAPATASDTRGRIESINPTEGKVKLKHGPIPKFDMPGMTMVFRVQDPKLLTQIKVGDEVGVTLEKSGGSLVITGFQK